ncbi:MAG: methylmalonyl-CoA/ethylmalonyl-CoA epimerase [Cryomorphaceae bacterium]
MEFYQHTLGLTLLFEAPPGLAFFDCGGVRLMVTTQQGDAADHKTSAIYYKVTDIHAATSSLQAKDVEFEREPQLAARMPDHELWIGFLRDPDHNLVGIMAELRLSD